MGLGSFRTPEMGLPVVREGPYLGAYSACGFTQSAQRNVKGCKGRGQRSLGGGGDAQDRAKAGYGDGAVVMLFEGLASKSPGLVDEIGAMGKGLKEIDQGSRIARFDMPAAAVFFDDTRGSSLPWSDE